MNDLEARLTKAKAWLPTVSPDDEAVGLYIVKTAGVVGGRARIEGTRIAVWHLAERLRAGDSARDLLDDFPYLGIERITSALIYAVDHEAEIAADIREQDEAFA